ncbi:hypothetical protein Y032_0111g234 [Ancylostoma ceylanicum]|nr:hypothetical protein Y032_0111g234 [Ancylostoma ceylanicum]
MMLLFTLTNRITVRVVKIVRGEAWGNKKEEYLGYIVEYLLHIKWFPLWNVEPEKFVVRRLQYGQTCSVELEVGEIYLVGYNFKPYFEFARLFSTVTPAELEMLKFKKCDPREYPFAGLPDLKTNFSRIL